MAVPSLNASGGKRVAALGVSVQSCIPKVHSGLRVILGYGISGPTMQLLVRCGPHRFLHDINGRSIQRQRSNAGAWSNDAQP